MPSKYKAKRKPKAPQMRVIAFCTSCGYSSSNVYDRATCTCGGTYQVRKAHPRDMEELKRLHTHIDFKV